jgi:hypothetical protein
MVLKAAGIQLVLGKGFGKIGEAAAIGPRAKEHKLVVRRAQHRIQCLREGGSDGAGRQALVPIGIVGRINLFIHVQHALAGT